jgi:hypothetical protein
MDVYDSDSSDEDDAFQDDLETSLLIALMSIMPTTERLFKWPNTRLNWVQHVLKLLHTKEFGQTYRMSHDAFQTLLDILRPTITVDVVKSRNSTPSSEPIYPELVMHIGLRWLAGGAFADIRDTVGVSSPSVYRCRDMFIDAVLAAQELDLKFPETLEEVYKAAIRFKQKSSNGVMSGCVGCLDGILITIRQPPRVVNPRAFYSGHYCSMGLNVQAVCDARLRFTYLAVAAPGKSLVCIEFLLLDVSYCMCLIRWLLVCTSQRAGKTPDISAYREINLPNLVEKLPPVLRPRRPSLHALRALADSVFWGE